MAFDIKFIGAKELRAAINRNPQMVLAETKNFLVRGLAIYKAGIIRSPWRVGGTGGGAPVSNDPRYPRPSQKQRSGNLRDTHVTQISGLMGWIGPNTQAAPYAHFVHEGTPGGQMKRRPWLDYVKTAGESEIQRLYRILLQNITRDLAK